MMNSIIAGIGQRDITPPKGVRLAGYPHFPRENTGFHDPLYVTSLYVFNGTTEFVFSTLDILLFSKKYTTEVRQKLRQSCGIPERNILFSCSHTHSGPWAGGNPELKDTPEDKADIDPAYLAFLLQQIQESVEAAKATAFPAEIGFNSALCGAESGVGGNRRHKDGITDPFVNVIAIRDMEKNIRGILTNYALHPTFLHEDSTLVSSDYPHYLRTQLMKVYPDAVVGFAEGASGDQSSRYFRQGQSFDEAERVGTLMGKSAQTAIKTMTFTSSAELQHTYLEVPIPIREYPSIAELEEKVRIRTEQYEQLKAAGASYLDVQNANLRMLGAEDMLGYALCLRDGKRIDCLEDEIPAEISVFRIGDSVIVGLQGEVFVEYALQIRSNTLANHTFVFCLANGYLPGYCVNDEAYAEDGYEAGNCMLAPGFGQTMVQTALALLEEVFSA